MSALAKLKASNAESSQWRRHIHAHPETAFEEFKTSDYVANLLTSWGVEIHRGMAKTAVVGVIHGKTNKSKRAVGLRADMDALNILEETNVHHCSKQTSLIGDWHLNWTVVAIGHQFGKDSRAT